MPHRSLRVFAGLLGAFFGLALLKFGNPPIMEKWVESPENIYELLLGTPWPVTWAYLLLGALGVFGLVIAWRLHLVHSPGHGWVVWLPLAWIGWQVLATTQSLDRGLSWPTVKHFAACLVCFYLGLYLLSQVERLGAFWAGLVLGFLLMIAAGWQQHFGGLEATRQFFFREIYPHLKEVPPEYLKKMTSNRIFSTLFYPNTLAGALLLLLPPLLALVAQTRGLFTLSARRFLVAGMGIGGLGCLYWSGSKGGWLLLLLLALIALCQVPFSRRLKVALIAGVLLVGMAGFIWRYAAFFQKGATSVGARFDYWDAAFKTALAHPGLGTGPGTFMIPYRAIKRPESEMTRMVHNDYLEQASDSGWFGFAAYALFVGGGLVLTGRLVLSPAKRTPDNPGGKDWTQFFIWLGLLGWALQGLFEFGLYVPALAWPAFAFLGLLLGRGRNTMDKPQSAL